MSDERKDDGGPFQPDMSFNQFVHMLRDDIEDAELQDDGAQARFLRHALHFLTDGEGVPPSNGCLDCMDLRAALRELREPRHCPTCRHHEVDDKGDHWCALGISTAGRVRGLVTHLQPFGCSKHEAKETGDDE